MPTDRKDAPIRWPHERLAPFRARWPGKDAPAVGIFDEPRHCVAVNVEWLAHLLGLLAAGEYEDFWTDQTSQHGTEQWSRLLDALGTGESMCSDCPVPTPIWDGTRLGWDLDGDGSADTEFIELAGPAGPPGADGPAGPAGPPGEAGPPAVINEYPPLPDTATDEMCNAANYAAGQLIALCQDVISAAQTSTLATWIATFLYLPGFNLAAGIALFQHVLPDQSDLSTRLAAAGNREQLAKAMYLNNLDRTASSAALMPLDATQIEQDVKTVYVMALEVITDALVQAWATAGAYVDEGMDCEQTWNPAPELAWFEADFRIGLSGWTITEGTHINGQGIESKYTPSWPGYDRERIDIRYSLSEPQNLNGIKVFWVKGASRFSSLKIYAGSSGTSAGSYSNYSQDGYSVVEFSRSTAQPIDVADFNNVTDLRIYQNFSNRFSKPDPLALVVKVEVW